MKRGIIAVALALLTLTGAALVPALAHPGQPHDTNDMYADTWTLGGKSYKTSSWFENRPQWQSDLEWSFDEIDSELGANLHFNYSNPPGEIDNGAQDWESFDRREDIAGIKSFYGGAGLVVVDTDVHLGVDSVFSSHSDVASGGSYDTDNDGDLDFFLIVYNEDDFNLSTNDGQNPPAPPIRGVSTHEIMHVTGFNGHWAGSLGICQDSAGINTLTMCPVATNAMFYWMASLAHNDSAELQEAY
jgi:hypothetical protein